MDGLLAFARIAGVVDAFVEFREGDYRHGDAQCAELLDAGDNIRPAVQIMDHPVSIDEVAHRSDSDAR